MARITKKNNPKSVSVKYDLWPYDGEATGMMEEWDNGEGIDLDLNGTKIELTHQELHAVVALAGLFYCKLND